MLFKFKKEKIKKFEENECTIWRWVLVVIIGFIIGVIISNAVMIVCILTNVFQIQIFSELGDSNIIKAFVAFACYFVSLVIAVRLIAKTSIKSFIFGLGGKLNKKESVAILGTYLFGLILASLLDLKTTRFSGVSVSQYLISFLWCSIFGWMQTTWEEFVFRGIVIRAVCKNNIVFNIKSFLAGLISTTVFALLHIANPELTSQNTLLQKILMLLYYFIMGFFIYISDLVGKSLMPGILIHWIHNFFMFTIVRDKVSALETRALFINFSALTGFDYLLRGFVIWLPIFAFYIYKTRKSSVLNESI